jgi:hypothetical protein
MGDSHARWQIQGFFFIVKFVQRIVGQKNMVGGIGGAKLFGQMVVLDWKAYVDNKWREKIGVQI